MRAPRLSRLSAEHAEALERFVYLIQERKGAGLLTGEYGCGKTTMVRVLGERLDLSQHRVAYLNYPRFGPDQLLGEILYQLGEDKEGDNVERMADVITQVEESIRALKLFESQIQEGMRDHSTEEFTVDGVSNLPAPLARFLADPDDFRSPWPEVLPSALVAVAVLLLVSSLLAVVYVWRLVEAAYFSEPEGRSAEATEAPWPMVGTIWLLAGACLYFGIDTDLTVGIAEQAAKLCARLAQPSPARRGPATRVIDLQGRFALPGFNESKALPFRCNGLGCAV